MSYIAHSSFKNLKQPKQRMIVLQRRICKLLNFHFFQVWFNSCLFPFSMFSTQQIRQELRKNTHCKLANNVVAIDSMQMIFAIE